MNDGSTGTSSGIMLGNPVTGDDFFGRDADLADLLDLFEQGMHPLVAAPRRIGKTSLLLEAKRRLDGRYVFLFVDVQDCSSEADAVVQLVFQAREHREIGHKILDGFKNVLTALTKSVEEVGAAELKLKLRDGLAADWKSKADEVLDRLAACEKPVVVWFDELPVLVLNLLAGDDQRATAAGIKRARTFLSWLRAASIRHRGKIRFALSGSIGLEPLVARVGMSDTLNTFVPFALGAWDRDTALDFLEDRAQRNGLQFGEGAVERLVDTLGLAIPHHVQMFLYHVIRDARRRNDSGVAVGDVERVYKSGVLSVQGHGDLATYEERLRRVVPPEAFPVALDLLTEAAVVGRLDLDSGHAILSFHEVPHPQASEILGFLLQVFEHDGYLRRDGDRYLFASHLLRDWWRHRFEFGYLPASER